jgi:hypothetical protein
VFLPEHSQLKLRTHGDSLLKWLLSTKRFYNFQKEINLKISAI